MLKKQMVLSLTVLITAAVLFIVVTFAWLTVSEIVNIDGAFITLEDVDATVQLQVSTDVDHIEYTLVEGGISLDNAVPGDVFYYRLLITNTGLKPILSRVVFNGFIDEPANDLIAYDEEQSLINCIVLNSYNTANASTIENDLISTRIGELSGGLTYANASFILVSDVDIAVGEDEYVYFTFTVAEDAGNEYQNLKLTISSILIQSAAD